MALALRVLNTSKYRAVSNNINLKCLVLLIRVSRNYAIIRQQVDNDPSLILYRCSDIITMNAVFLFGWLKFIYMYNICI